MSINYYIVNMVVLDFFCVCFNWLLYVVEGMLMIRVFISGFVVNFVCKVGIYFRGIL